MYEGEIKSRVVASVTIFSGSTRAHEVLLERAKSLDGSAAGSAEMRANRTQGPTLRTEASGAGWHVTRIMWTVRCDGPDERRDPSNQRPAQKKVQKENTGSVGFVSANNGRQKVENSYE